MEKNDNGFPENRFAPRCLVKTPKAIDLAAIDQRTRPSSFRAIGSESAAGTALALRGDPTAQVAAGIEAAAASELARYIVDGERTRESGFASKMTPKQNGVVDMLNLTSPKQRSGDIRILIAAMFSMLALVVFGAITALSNFAH